MIDIYAGCYNCDVKKPCKEHNYIFQPAVVPPDIPRHRDTFYGETSKVEIDNAFKRLAEAINELKQISRLYKTKRRRAVTRLGRKAINKTIRRPKSKTSRS